MATAWAIDGVEVPASVARLLAYVAGGGGDGVVEPGGLKVTPLDTPGASVRVMPGAGLVTNRYPGGGQQSYAIQETTAATVPIAATGSGGGRTDLVVARIRDEQYGAGPAGVTFEVIQGVGAAETAAYVEALAYPALALARVTLPASTATVQAQHITDLRHLANPRTTRHVETFSIAPGLELYASSFALWPAETPVVQVPTWANEAVVRFEFTAGIRDGNSVGEFQLRLGGQTISQVGYNTDMTIGIGDTGARWHLLVAGTATISTSAGESRTVSLRGRRTSGNGRLITVSGAQGVVDVQFNETTV